ncbi:MAG: hypothetical protein M3Q87_07820, partial [Actinomycetota bacterium]|nr:hypothetical protein [Actinomycetota bacterium]
MGELTDTLREATAPAGGTERGRPGWHDSKVLQWTPSQRELDDLELVLLGAAAPETLSIDLPAELAGRVDADSGGDGAVVELLDPEGLALARLTPATGHVQPLSQPAFGPFRRYVIPASRVRAEHPEAFVVPV